MGTAGAGLYLGEISPVRCVAAGASAPSLLRDFGARRTGSTQGNQNPHQSRSIGRGSEIERLPGILALRESARQGKVHDAVCLGVGPDEGLADAAQEFFHV